MTLSIGDKPIFGNYKVLIKDVSFDKFLEFATEDISCELLDGVLIINSPAGYIHESIFRFLLTYLDQIGLENNIGRVLGSRFVVKLDSKWGPEPDLLFYRNNKRKYITKTYFNGIPDLILEILSPTNKEEDLFTKLPKYLEFQVPEIWIIDPEERTLSIHISKSEKYLFSNEDDLIQSKTIPEIKLKLKWLWDEKSNPIICLRELMD